MIGVYEFIVALNIGGWLGKTLPGKRFFQGIGPSFQPLNPFLTDIGIGQAIGRIAHGLFQGHGLDFVLFQKVSQRIHAVGIEACDVQ